MKIEKGDLLYGKGARVEVLALTDTVHADATPIALVRVTRAMGTEIARLSCNELSLWVNGHTPLATGEKPS